MKKQSSCLNVNVRTLSELTFAVAEVQLQDGLEERVCVEDKVKIRADLGLQRPLDPLVLRGRDTLDKGIRDLWRRRNFEAIFFLERNL